MESSLVSAGHNIQHSYVRKEHSYVREERSTFSDCFDGNYSLSPNLDAENMELEWFDVIKYPSTSDCFNGNYVPTHNPYTEDMLDLKPFDLINYITTDSSCNIPMETGSQQTHSAWDVDRTGVEASKSAAYQSMNVLHDDRPMTTYDANKPPITQVYDRNKRQNQTVVSGDVEVVNPRDASLFKTPSTLPISNWINVSLRNYASKRQNITNSLCNTPMETGSQQEQVVAKDEDPEFKELADQVLDMEYEKRKRESMYKTEEVNVYGRKLSSLGQNIPDSFCNTPMETGSQQTRSAWDVDCTGVEASKSAAYQSMNVLHEDRPMTTYDANMPLQSTTNVNPTQVDDRNKRQNQTVVSDDLDFVNQITPLFNATPSNAPYVYGVLPATGEQNIPELCNTPMETGSQQTSSAWYVDHTGVEASKSAAYQSMNVLHDDTPITTDNQQTECYTPIATGSQQEQVVDPECKKCYQRAKQLRKRYKSAFQTIGREQPLKRLYSRMQIAPCLGACRRTPNVSVLHNRKCVLYNMPLLKKLQKNNPQTLHQVKEHLTNINMDRADFKNLLFHEKLDKMLDKIECALAYIESCCDKYIYLVAFKLQLTELVTRGRNSHPNPDTLTQSNVIEFLRHMKNKINNVDELIINLMQKDMSYYQLKVDLNNMLEMMSNHEYAEVGESYYHGLKLESCIDTFIENYKKVSESVKEKLDIQNNYTDCESISCYYKDYKEYLNLLINSLDETNSVPDNNSVFVEDPIISNPHLKAFYNDMHKASSNKLYRENRKLCKLTTESDICLFMKDLSRLLYATEELHVALENTLEILSNSKQSDVVRYNIIKARKQILHCASEQNKKYLSVKELGRMEMKKTWVYINTKVPIKEYSLRCMRSCMWFSLSRGSQVCKTVKESLSSTLFKKLGSKFQFLEEYIDYNKAVIDVLKEKWFPKKMVSQKK